MTAKRNFLLGHGERLTEPILVRTRPGDKEAPYTVSENKRWLAPRIAYVAARLARLPAAACPEGAVVGSLIINPEYIAKSYYPEDLLHEAGLHALGSKPKRVTPRKRSKNRPPEEAWTTELFVVGQLRAFSQWAASLPNWVEGTSASESLVAIEDVEAPEPRGKIKGDLPSQERAVFEVVLHAGGIGDDPSEPFHGYLDHLEIEALPGRRFSAGGLLFLEVEAPVAEAEAIATYTMVRLLRQMPGLRVLRPTIAAVRLPAGALDPPPAAPVDPTTVAALFDGGLPDDHPLTAWARPIDAPGVGGSLPYYLDHGVGVTSAFLFGHIDPAAPLPRPYCRVDHYRVLDAAPGQDTHELYEVLQRIRDVLNAHDYPLVNLSLGPTLAIEDDEVSAWTAVLDAHLARGEILATFAVGNASDPAIKVGRIQSPADCVNALSVGACDRPDGGWRRAHYSLVGPGRTPGVVKPDLLAFGGSMPRPFLVTGPGTTLSLHPTGGTSFAAPSVLRLGAGIRAHFGPSLSLLAIRAVLIHGCEASDHPKTEVGRGRLGFELEPLVLCDDDEVRVVYQGEITPSKYIRAAIPTPAEPMVGLVTIKATLCSITPVDPHHPGNYTRAGLEATFRPRSDLRSRADQVHANTYPFFGRARQGITEEELRRDAWKWENVQHATIRMRGGSLHVDFHAELTRVFHRELTRLNLWFAVHAGVKFLPFSFRPFVAAALALKRKLSLPVSTMWQ